MLPSERNTVIDVAFIGNQYQAENAPFLPGHGKAAEVDQQACGLWVSLQVLDKGFRLVIFFVSLTSFEGRISGLDD